ncbi:MAG TPA: hypothetical protein VF406_18910 [Thermodesulfobacteriota bacterium]
MSTTPPADERPRPAPDGAPLPAATTPLADPDLRALLDRPLLDGPRFLSLYLDARADAQGKRHFGIFLDKRAKSARSRISGAGGDLLGYDRLIDRARDYVRSVDLDGVAGIAVFAEIPAARAETGGEGPFFQAFRLPVGVENRFILGRGPDLGPILRAIGRYAHYLAIRLDADDARILSVYLSRVVGAEAERAEGSDQTFQGRIRSQPGGWAQMHTQRHKEEHAQRWLRDLAGEVERIVRREAPDGVVLLGQDVNLAAFREELPQALAERIVGTGTVEPHAGDAEIVAKVEPLVEATRRAARERMVDELHDRVLGDFYAVGGVDDTLEALQQGKVERVVVSRRFDARGGRCERCGFVVGAGHPACPYCGGPLVEVQVLQYLVEKAEDQRATVEFVGDPDPRLDDDLEGVGAFLRF